MTWFKVDDTFYAHPKVVALEAGPCCHEAISLWVLAGSWSAGQLTDGEIPSSLVRKLGFKPRVAQELIRVGLWRETDHGYAFHEWSNYQPTREEVENRRHATKERVSRHRNGVTNASRNSVQTSAGNGVSNAAPVPSRPDPTEGRGESARARATPTPGGSASPAPSSVAASRSPPGPEPAGSPPAGLSAERLCAVLRELVLATWRVDPSVAWHGAADFAERVANTAAAQQREPEALLRTLLGRWLAAPRNERERAAPLPCFAADFAELAAQAPGSNGAAPLSGTPENIERVRAELAKVVTPKPSGWTA